MPLEILKCYILLEVIKVIHYNKTSLKCIGFQALHMCQIMFYYLNQFRRHGSNKNGGLAVHSHTVLTKAIKKGLYSCG